MNISDRQIHSLFASTRIMLAARVSVCLLGQFLNVSRFANVRRDRYTVINHTLSIPSTKY